MQRCVDCDAEGARGFFGSDTRPDGPLCSDCWNKRREASEERLGKCPLCAETPTAFISKNAYILKAEEYLWKAEPLKQKYLTIRLPVEGEVAQYLMAKTREDKCSVTSIVMGIIRRHMEDE